MARIANHTPRTTQNYIRALKDDWLAPLEFDHKKKGFYFTDPAWRPPSIKLRRREWKNVGALSNFDFLERYIG